MATEHEPNQGAAGDAPATVEPTVAGPPPPETEVNQGATGEAPPLGEDRGESPLTVESESDPFAERPEAFVGAAFVGGFALAQILKRLGPS
jgi:hypothetical protein